MSPLLIEKFLHLALMKKEATMWRWTNKHIFPRNIWHWSIQSNLLYYLFPFIVLDSNGWLAPWPLQRTQLLIKFCEVEKRQKVTNIYQMTTMSISGKILKKIVNVVVFWEGNWVVTREQEWVGSLFWTTFPCV